MFPKALILYLGTSDAKHRDYPCSYTFLLIHLWRNVTVLFYLCFTRQLRWFCEKKLTKKINFYCDYEALKVFRKYRCHPVTRPNPGKAIARDWITYATAAYVPQNYTVVMIKWLSSKQDLKGQCREIFASGFFHRSSFPKPLKITIGSFPILLKIRKSSCTTNINDTTTTTTTSTKICHLCQLHGWIATSISTTPAVNLPPVSTTPVVNNENNIRLLKWNRCRVAESGWIRLPHLCPSHHHRYQRRHKEDPPSFKEIMNWTLNCYFSTQKVTIWEWLLKIPKEFFCIVF